MVVPDGFLSMMTSPSLLSLLDESSITKNPSAPIVDVGDAIVPTPSASVQPVKSTFDVDALYNSIHSFSPDTGSETNSLITTRGIPAPAPSDVTVTFNV